MSRAFVLAASLALALAAPAAPALAAAPTTNSCVSHIESRPPPHSHGRGVNRGRHGGKGGHHGHHRDAHSGLATGRRQH